MSEEKVNGVLHCTAFGDLSPADICEGCEECRRNNDFADRGGYPAMLLTGSRENLAVALRQPGVPIEMVGGDHNYCIVRAGEMAIEEIIERRKAAGWKTAH